MNISVIATYHATKGLVTPQALLGLLERIGPEVIFLECPEDAFADFHNGTDQTLESTAVRLYCEGRRVALVPVDAPWPPSSFWRDTEELFRRVGRVSADYRRLHDAYMNAMAQGGFPYLNSDGATGALAAIDAEVVASLEWMNSRDLFPLYDTWRETNDAREDTMLSGIGTYSRQHRFSRAVFLVGAAHRQSLIRKTHSALPTGPPSLQWTFITLPGS